uniref:Si:ch211-244c8.4 n=1 Tax=Astyanax mexicanus TaxID=7994 RepID=A0A8B9H3X3_ASTMX
MDTQSESCEPPPCDPQPPGKIRKALKLFNKRKPGSSMASIFSMRSKSEGGPKSPPSRSKTLDGLTESVAPEAEAESMDLDQEESQKEDAPMEEPESKDGNGNGNLETTPTRQSISSITSAKSLSFLNMLRRSRKGGGGERYAQTESQRPGRQRKGLKGLFGSVRWPGKDKEAVDEVEPGPPLLASRSNSVEIIKENLTLTPRPAPRSPDDSEIEQQPPASQDEPVSSEDSTKVSETAKQPANDRLSTLLGDISSILSFDTLTSGGDIVADVEAEWAKVSNRVEETDVTGKKDNALSAAVSAKLKPTLSPTPTLKPESPPLQATFSTGPRGEKTGVHTRPQQPQPAAQDQLPVAAYKSEKKSPAVKSAALSKIPVSGGGRPKQLHKDGQSNGDEGHWNLPTPVHEEESPVTLSRESSSKEPLSDFSTGSGAVTPTLSHSHEDILDSRPIIGATSLPRESKIPMKPGSTATYHSLQGKTEAARSKIPVSKMPVRRTSNKPPSTATQK